MLLTAALIYLVIVGIVMMTLAIAASDPTVDAEWLQSPASLEPWQSSTVTDIWPQNSVSEADVPTFEDVPLAA